MEKQELTRSEFVLGIHYRLLNLYGTCQTVGIKNFNYFLKKYYLPQKPTNSCDRCIHDTFKKTLRSFNKYKKEEPKRFNKELKLVMKGGK